MTNSGTAGITRITLWSLWTSQQRWLVEKGVREILENVTVIVWVCDEEGLYPTDVHSDLCGALAGRLAEALIYLALYMYCTTLFNVTLCCECPILGFIPFPLLCSFINLYYFILQCCLIIGPVQPFPLICLLTTCYIAIDALIVR